MLTCLFLTAFAAQSSTPVLTDQLHGFKNNQGLGGVTLDMGDLNGDGIHDIAVSSPGFDFPELETYSSGRVEVLSGADFSVLFTRNARADLDFGIGDHLVNMGDINGDGINDLFVSADGSNLGYVLSGADGSLHHRVQLDGTVHFTSSVDNAGDLTGDGIDDLIFGFWSETFSDQQTGEWAFQAGFVRGFDGLTGRMLFEFHGTSDYSGVGKTVKGLGDINGDGTPDIASIDAGFGLGNFTLRVHSGVDGEELFTLSDVRVETLGSLNVDAMDDINKDGIPEILLSLHSRENELGHSKAMTFFLSGADQSVLQKIEGGDYPWPGRVARTIGDMDGDGFRDVGLGEPIVVNGKDRFSVRVISGLDGSTLSVIDTGRNFWYGHSFAPIADRDGDGRDELMIGLPFAPSPDVEWEHNYGAVQFWSLH